MIFAILLELRRFHTKNVNYANYNADYISVFIVSMQSSYVVCRFKCSDWLSMLQCYKVIPKYCYSVSLSFWLWCGLDY